MQAHRYIELNMGIGSPLVGDLLDDHSKLCEAILPSKACFDDDASTDEASWRDQFIGLIIEVPANFDDNEEKEAKDESTNDVPLCMSASYRQVRRRSLAKGDPILPLRDERIMNMKRRLSIGTKSRRASHNSSSTTVLLGDSWNTRFAPTTSSGKSDRSMRLPAKSVDSAPSSTRSVSPRPAVSRVRSSKPCKRDSLPSLHPFEDRN